ncbi:protein SYS1 homolog [Sitodiplosis mosellana]|uniref:protein SYS1 homolog n=1 Tax=Sitodiplosis mosellana TaxID=263140 RepID=UPI002443E046|nr:protein SYS1 homolog [Sitodiplosis mosellana]
MKMKTGFRNTQWDPLLLIAQIIAVQSLLYVSLGFIMAFMDVFVGANHTLDHLFQYHEIHVTDSGGRSVILSFVLNAFVGALALRFIVGRTKLCLDFTCTYHFAHLFICWVYNGAFPSTFSWWFLNAVCATVMCVFSEFLCLRIELKEIPVGYTPLDTKADL